MQALLYNIRFYVLVTGIILSGVIAVFVFSSTTVGLVQVTKLTQWYGLFSLLLLYISLIGTPIAKLFPSTPYLTQYNKARRATGVLTWYYAFLHALIAFFGELGGFTGLSFLSSRYLISISLSFIALCLLCFLSLTSIELISKEIVKRGWTVIFKLVYVVGVLVLIHAAILGTHFTTFSKTLPFIILLLLFVFFLLESARFDQYIRLKFPAFPKSIVFLYCLANLVGITGYVLLVKQPLSVHGAAMVESMPGMKVNMTNGLMVLPENKKRYITYLNTTGEREPNKPVTLTFTVFDTLSSKDVTLFSTPYEKPFHLIITSLDLRYFTHIHPVVQGNSLTITTTFPKKGRYMLYTDFIPFNGVEQQFPFSLDIGHDIPLDLATSPPDTKFTKTFQGYTVTLKNHLPLSAKKLENGQEQVHFYIDDKNHKPFSNLYPYLNAFGHMIMVNQKTLEYIHVHPTVLFSKQSPRGGPDIYFMPMSLKGLITPGVYRIFTELNPDGTLILVEFTVTISE